MKVTGVCKILSVEDLAASTQALFLLTGKPELTLEEEEAVALLTVLIERYESEKYPLTLLSA